MGIKTMVTRAVGKQSLRFKSNSPHILFVGGVAGVVAGTVLACRATLKLESTVDRIKHNVENVKGLVPDEEGKQGNYPANEYRKDLAYVYGRGTLEMVKLYGPAVAVTSVSILALTGSHVQLSRRNTALTAAYTGLHQAYNEYRNRVRTEVGEERERDIYNNVVVKEIEGENGKLQKIKDIDPNGLSIYARMFDDLSPNFSKDPEVNRLFIKCQQNYANDLLHARGHLFLNEVYDMLGLTRDPAGQVVGWTVGDGGDDYVSFGLFDPGNSRFIAGWEPCIVLDFNVDGPILNKFTKG